MPLHRTLEEEITSHCITASSYAKSIVGNVEKTLSRKKSNMNMLMKDMLMSPRGEGSCGLNDKQLSNV